MASDVPEPEKKSRSSRTGRAKESAKELIPPNAEIATKTEAWPVPIDHLTKATTKHVASLKEERRQLLDDMDFLRKEIARYETKADRLQTRLDELQPQLARTVAVLQNITGNALIASVFVGIGGTAVSAAGLAPDSYRPPMLFAGIAA